MLEVVAAEGEKNAAVALKEASDTISDGGCALQLRYLQTLTQIAVEKNSTIVGGEEVGDINVSNNAGLKVGNGDGIGEGGREGAGNGAVGVGPGVTGAAVGAFVICTYGT